MDGFDLRFVQMYQCLNEGDMHSLTDDEFEKRSMASDLAFQSVQQLRGRVLTMAAELENLIADCIALYFMPFEGPRQDRFRISVLEKEACSFYTKYMILKEIHEALGKNQPHPSWSKIEELMRIRNIFAHGRIFIDWQTQEVFIKHSKGTDSTKAKFQKFWEVYSASWTEIGEFRRRIENAS